MAESVEQDVDITLENAYIPIISAHSIKNGLICIDINNSADLWTHFQEIRAKFNVEADAHCLRLHYRVALAASKYIKHHDWCEEALSTHTLLIHDRIFNVGAKTYFRFPLFLSPIIAELKMGYQHPTTKAIHFSDSIQLEIDTFNHENTYKIGEKIKFRSETVNECKGKFFPTAEIIEILSDDCYKIKSKYYDPYKGDYGNDEACEDKLISLPGSQIRKAIPQNAIILHRFETESGLLLRQRNAACEEIFDAVWDAAWMIIEGQAGAGLEFSSAFIGKVVFDFLFEPEFDFKVGCLLDGNHSHCEMMNVRQSIVRNLCDSYHGFHEFRSIQDELENTWYGCDLCKIRLNEWDFFFECKGGYKHYFCRYCIFQTVISYHELRGILMNVLEDKLILNCIEMIADYAVGVVRMFENEEEKETRETVNDRKRSLDGGDLPINKKRHLD